MKYLLCFNIVTMSHLMNEDEDEIAKLEAKIKQEDENFVAVFTDLKLLAENKADSKHSLDEQRLADIKLVFPVVLQIISDLLRQLEELTDEKLDVTYPEPDPNLDLEARYKICENTIDLLHKKILIELKKKEEQFSNEEKIAQLKKLLEQKKETIADLYEQKKELEEEQR